MAVILFVVRVHFQEQEPVIFMPKEENETKDVVQEAVAKMEEGVDAVELFGKEG